MEYFSCELLYLKFWFHFLMFYKIFQFIISVLDLWFEIDFLVEWWVLRVFVSVFFTPCGLGLDLYFEHLLLCSCSAVTSPVVANTERLPFAARVRLDMSQLRSVTLGWCRRYGLGDRGIGVCFTAVVAIIVSSGDLGQVLGDQSASDVVGCFSRS